MSGWSHRASPGVPNFENSANIMMWNHHFNKKVSPVMQNSVNCTSISVEKARDLHYETQTRVFIAYIFTAREQIPHAIAKIAIYAEIYQKTSSCGHFLIFFFLLKTFLIPFSDAYKFHTFLLNSRQIWELRTVSSEVMYTLCLMYGKRKRINLW